MSRNLAGLAAVTAVVLAEHGESLDVCGVDVRAYPQPTTGADVSMQVASRRDWAADLAGVARAAVALGFDFVRFFPEDGYVRVVTVGEVSTSAGTARVEVWDHLNGADVGRAERVLDVDLGAGVDPVFVAVSDVTRRLAVMAVGRVA
ncbi:hypothetical protein [Saccharothrix hoggarensis]